MISRRLLRVKIMHILYAHFQSNEKSYSNSKKELLFSINKAYDLYYYILLLILDIRRYTELKIEFAQNKRIPTAEDLNPNRRFVNNKVISQISCNKQFNSYINSKRMSWVNHQELIKELYTEIIKSEAFESYMNKPECNYKDDRDFISHILINHIVNSESLHQILEEQSIYWNDDLEFIISMIIKTIKQFNERSGEETSLMSLYKNNDDKDFVINLLNKTIANHSESKKIISNHTKNWEIERIAFMDVVVMEMAISEIIEFESIPIKVTLNEYIEIIKFYSTAKSSTFINGILDKILNYLKKEKKIKKIGRGLIEG